NYTIIPIKNTNSNKINNIYNLLQHTNLSIINKLTIPINHYILINTSTKTNKIQTIYNHPQPFQQYNQYLNHCPH
ncbi:bifunctional chorismate mutase/prephenate dehydratase, partial [Bacillus thuringiensis]|nr:bifunctional chorismate mutase/prephenate dehydratase [Bacillus thuringiensis]